MLLPFDGRDELAENTKLLAKLLEIERERLALTINTMGLNSKETYVQSQIVDKLVLKYMRSMQHR